MNVDMLYNYKVLYMHILLIVFAACASDLPPGAEK